MSNNRITALTTHRVAKTSVTYSLDELYQEIANNDEWKTNFRYVPKASKANLKFHQKPPDSEDGKSLGKKLWIGNHKGFKNRRAYAEVCRSSYGPYNSVRIDLHDGTVIGLQSMEKDDEPDMLRDVHYVQPFNRIGGIGSSGWRKALRFLVLYYFLEKGLIEKLAFTSEGVDSLRRACIYIAKEPIRKAQGAVRAPLKLRESIALSKKRVLQAPAIAKTTSTVKKETLPVAVPVKAPENDSTLAVKNMITSNDDIAARLLWKGPW